MFRIWMILIGLLFPFTAQAADVGKRHMIQVGELEREYYLFTPSKASNAPRALVVVMHGGFGNPEAAAKVSEFSKVAERENFLVAYPAGTGRIPTWNAGSCCGYAERKQVDDVGFIRAMVAEISKSHKVDAGRIYATGMSNGGMMAYRLACEMGDVFTAIAPVAGAMNTRQCEPNGRPSVVIFHALDDKHVLYQGGASQEGGRAMFGKEPEPDRSIADAMKFWMTHNMCRKYPATTTMSDYSMQNYFCAENREVRLYTLNSGGHSWPGGEKARKRGDAPLDSISATEKIWEFFNAHPPQEVF